MFRTARLLELGVAKYALWCVGILAVLFFSIFTTISLHRFWQFSVWYYDFGIFYQAISAVAHGQAPIIDHLIVPGKLIFADHFHPFIFSVVPFFLLVPLPETLLVVQSLFITLSGVVMYFVAQKLLNSKVAAVLFACMYYSFFGLHFALITEFHEIGLLPLPLAIFFLGMVRRSWWPLVLGWIGVLLIKESTFIIPAWFGLVMAVQYPKKLKLIGVAIAGLSLLYGYTVISFVIPYFSGSEYYYAQGVGLGSTLETLPDLLTHSTIWRVFASYAFLPFLAPETLAPVAFNWWSRVQSGGPRIGFGMHYNAELAPTLLLGAIIGWTRLRKIAHRITFPYFLSKISSTAVLFGLTGALFILNMYVYKSPALLFFNPAFYKHTKTSLFLDRLLSHVPPTGTVMAQHNLAARLAYRRVFILRNPYDEFDPDYIVFDTRDGQEPNNFFGLSRWDDLVEMITTDPNYELYYDQGEQFIYKKKSL
jgi:uncharacterized membrane protein